MGRWSASMEVVGQHGGIAADIVNRRAFLRGSAATVGATIVGGRRASATQPAGVFRHGVASGDPRADAVVLWTRVTTDATTPVTVSWVVSSDAGMADVVARGETEAAPARDFTVHVDVTGLGPAATYFYRFAALDDDSPVGRTRTAPTGATERLRLGVVSCSRLASGAFNAYGRLAQRELDLVLHLGDYIYEDGAGGVRPHEPRHELLTLTDYRSRYAQYRLDPDLQELHRLHPMAAVWDDHELAGNAWRDGAANHDPASQGPWTARRDAAVQAWHEWLPVRPPEPGDPFRIWRDLPLGDLANVVLLDTRLFGRERQVAPPAGADELDDPNRRLLGDRQRDFLLAQLRRESTWKIVGNQVMFSPLTIPAPNAAVADALTGFGFVTFDGQARNPDQWDGYGGERRLVLDAIEAEGIPGVVVLTGDLHSSWATEVRGEGDAEPAAVELVTPSVTSASVGEVAGDRVGGAGLIELAVTVSNPHVRFVEMASHGYVVLDLTRERALAEWWYVERIDQRDQAERFGAAWETAPRPLRLGEVQEPSASPTTTAPRPPEEQATTTVARERDGENDDGGLPGALVAGAAGVVAAAVGGAIALRRRRAG